MNKVSNNRHTKVDREAHRPQLYAKNYRLLRNAESGSNSLPQGRAQELVIKYQIVNPENTHTSNIIQSEQVEFIYLGVNMYMHMCM